MTMNDSSYIEIPVCNLSGLEIKLNSQFIATKFSILHAGGRSLFRFQTSRESDRGGGVQGTVYLAVLYLKSEIFWENPCRQ